MLPDNVVVFSVVLLSSFWNIWSLRNITTEKTWSAELVLLISSSIWYGFLISQDRWDTRDILILSEILLIVYSILLAHSFKKVYFTGLMIFTVMFL